ncbi:glycosyltransferase family 2 protein [Halioxenophilus sp. WMMB6]|uniref:glycosyltransferase family 2 protein n=1 Tax=Halioxenophilus sp. WMMB6 TaxID=3073815 RepID=UPI00295F1CCD|nr:glycosyltransferase family 2 protein [Halioxenophilus sp. WMMB6]
MQTRNDSLTIAIVSYNSAEVIINSLGDFIDQNAFPVVVVDNASQDGSAGTLRQRFPHIEVIALDTNIGYGRAANRVLQHCQSRYGLLLNPDISASVAGCERLIELLEGEANAAIIAPATDAKDAAQLPVREKRWVIGAALLFDMAKLRQLNFFDERIFLYYEEKDLCYRAWQAGYRVVLAPEVYFPHLRGKSTPASDANTYLRQWHVGWSSAYYNHKHGLDVGKRSLWRLRLGLWAKLISNFDPAKQLKFRARLAGIAAFTRGEQAFDRNGQPNANARLKK